MDFPLQWAARWGSVGWAEKPDPADMNGTDRGLPDGDCLRLRGATHSRGNAEPDANARFLVRCSGTAGPNCSRGIPLPHPPGGRTTGGVKPPSFRMLGDLILPNQGPDWLRRARRVIEQTLREKLPRVFQTARISARARLRRPDCSRTAAENSTLLQPAKRCKWLRTPWQQEQ